MDSSQWPQEIVVKPIEEIVTNSYPGGGIERKATRPQKEQALKCPRCSSMNTKFCYYNNYSLTQPRYFCKTCKRYWTEGGTLRNIPVGGSLRKNKRPFSSKKNLDDPIAQNPNKIHQDLNMASSSSLDLLSGISSKGMNSFIPMPIHDPNIVFPSGFSLQEFKQPTLNFSLDGFGSSSYGHETNGRLLFPFEDLRQISNTNDQNRDHQADSSGYWTGMLGGGSW